MARLGNGTTAMRTLKTLTMSAALAAAVPAQWAQLTTLTTAPTTRRFGAAAFDATANRLIFLGGVTPTPSVVVTDTWAFNGAWTLLNPPSGTTARWGHQLVRNPLTNRLLAFGGRSPTISGFANDTIEWTGTTWQTLSPPVRPQARYQYGMCFDSTRNVFVLFGGHNATTTFGDTWEFDGVTWTERTLPNSPPAREEMVLLYDADLHRTILFGGHNTGTGAILGDTWTYDGTDWTELTPASSPSARYRTQSVLDTTRRRAVVYGGYDGVQLLRDTWEFNGSDWTQVTTATAPVTATEALHGYDPVRKKFVLFGGYGGTFTNQTWEYTGANTGMFSEFGEGCPTANGPVTATSSVPRINQTWSISYDNMPADAELTLFAFGFSNQTWNSIPLPFGLAPIGLPQCNLLVAADLIEVAINSPSTLPAATKATFGLTIPNNLTLLNAQVYVQGIVLDLLAADFVFIGTSRGGRAVIGQ
jgi:hypothetical protein